MDANSSTKAEVALLKQNRRAFLKFLAASPYVAMLASSRLAFSQSAPVPLPNPYSPNLISSPKEALEVMDFSEPARRNMIMAHWGYLSRASTISNSARAAWSAR